MPSIRQYLVEAHPLTEAITRRPLVLYHGTDSAPFDNFKRSASAKPGRHWNPLGNALYATNSRTFAQRFGKNIHEIEIPAGVSYTRISKAKWLEIGRQIVQDALEQALRKLKISRAEVERDYDVNVADFETKIKNILANMTPYKSLGEIQYQVVFHYGDAIGKAFGQLLPAVAQAHLGRYDLVIFSQTEHDASEKEAGRSPWEVVIYNPSLQRTRIARS
jgi:hypothetical protein